MTDPIAMCRAYEARKGFGTHRRKALPTVVLTGYLGSGKTTLLRHLLRARGVRVGAVVGDAAGLFDANAARAASSSVLGVSGDTAPALPRAAPTAEKAMLCFCCTASGALEDAVYSVLKSGDGDGDGSDAADFGAIDYLAIETSGVTEPHALVAALSKRFGRMARVRVDAVVTVVDADMLAQLIDDAAAVDGTAVAQLPLALVAQLRAADVVLLNKRDLLAEHSAGSEAAVLALARASCDAGAAVHLCSLRDRAPPLELLLDVHPIDAIARTLTHEPAVPVYSLGSGAARRGGGGSGAGRGAGGGSGNAHLTRDAFGAVEWEAPTAVRLDRWQALLATSGGGTCSPAAAASPWRFVCRAKGTVVFDLDRDEEADKATTQQWSFQSSGLGGLRFSNEAIPGPRLGRARSSLVAIGPGLEGGASALLQRLLRWCTSGPDAGAGAVTDAEVIASHAALRDALDASTMFHVERGAASAAPLLRFRLDPAPLFGVASRVLVERYGVDVDGANVALADAVNGARGPLLVVPTLCADGEMRCVVALPPPLPLSKRDADGGVSAAAAVGALFAEALLEHARRVVKACTRTVPLCRCD